jgi:hypothetical protein
MDEDNIVQDEGAATIGDFSVLKGKFYHRASGAAEQGYSLESTEVHYPQAGEVVVVRESKSSVTFLLDGNYQRLPRADFDELIGAQAAPAEPPSSAVVPGEPAPTPTVAPVPAPVEPVASQPVASLTPDPTQPPAAIPDAAQGDSARVRSGDSEIAPYLGGRWASPSSAHPSIGLSLTYPVVYFHVLPVAVSILKIVVSVPTCPFGSHIENDEETSWYCRARICRRSLCARGLRVEQCREE